MPLLHHISCQSAAVQSPCLPSSASLWCFLFFEILLFPLFILSWRFCLCCIYCTLCDWIFFFNFMIIINFFSFFAMPALQKACSAARATGAASFMVILRMYLERVNGGLLRSSIFFFFLLKESQLQWTLDGVKQTGSTSEWFLKESARECFLSCCCLFNGLLQSQFTPDWVITIFHFFLYQLDFLHHVSSCL